MGLEEFWMAGAGVLNALVFYFGFLYHSTVQNQGRHLGELGRRT